MHAFQQFLQRASMRPTSQPYEKPTLQQDHSIEISEEWPKEPLPVHRKTLWSFCDLFVDILLAGSCSSFLVFALLVRTFDGHRKEDYETLTAGLTRAATLGPTVLPILFATVIGRATRACLAWRLEVGEKLGNLDVLASSTTFASAILAQVSLRSLSTLGCLLALVWALSPLGGQASLRIMTVGPTPIRNNADFDYLSMATSYVDWHAASVSGMESTATGLYLAALTSSERVKDSPRDLWDNIKIPMLEKIPSWTEDPNSTSMWHEIPGQNVAYAALVGISVSNLRSAAETANFNLETSYWRLDCPVVQSDADICDILGTEALLVDNPPLTSTLPDRPMNVEPPDPVCNRTDWLGNEGETMASRIYSNSSSRSGDGRDCVANNTCFSPRQFIYSGWGQGGKQFSAFCAITTSWIEVEVRCQGRECVVPRARRSQLPHPSANWTSLDGREFTSYRYFMGWFPSIADIRGSARGALPQGFLANPSDPSFALTEAVDVPNPGDLDPGVFAVRLGQLLNTWWIVSIGRSVVSSGVDRGKVGQIDDSNYAKLELNTTSGTVIHQVETIQCNPGWSVALVVVSLVMMMASAVPLLLRFWTRMPTFSLLVSTMLKDSPYFEAPRTGSTLESSDRSRLLRHRRVRYGDVAADENFGYLAVGSSHDGGDGRQRVGRVLKDRLYR